MEWNSGCIKAEVDLFNLACRPGKPIKHPLILICGNQTMNKILTIDDAEHYGLKQKAKISLGRFAAKAAPRRAKQLMLSPLSAPRGLRDKSIMAFLKHQARLEQREEFFEALHEDFWSGQGGDVFAENCDHRFEQMFLEKQKHDFEQLLKICATRAPHQIVEFGCNSGLLLNYMVQQFPNIKSAVGIDINRQQIERNRQADHFDPRIQFLTADGVDWVIENAEPNTLFVTNGGVMEYFRRSRLNLMMNRISAHLSPAIFFAIEPNASDHDLENNVNSIPFGEELSFSHNYKDLFVTNGFDVVHQRATTFESWKMTATIAVSD